MKKPVISATEIKLSLNKMSENSYKKYGSYSYIAGYQETLIASLMNFLSEKDKKMVLDQINQTAVSLEK